MPNYLVIALGSIDKASLDAGLALDVKLVKNVADQETAAQTAAAFWGADGSGRFAVVPATSLNVIRVPSRDTRSSSPVVE